MVIQLDSFPRKGFAYGLQAGVQNVKKASRCSNCQKSEQVFNESSKGKKTKVYNQCSRKVSRGSINVPA